MRSSGVAPRFDAVAEIGRREKPAKKESRQSEK
jgi:hypothetical protein